MMNLLVAVACCVACCLVVYHYGRAAVAYGQPDGAHEWLVWGITFGFAGGSIEYAYWVYYWATHPSNAPGYLDTPVQIISNAITFIAAGCHLVACWFWGCLAVDETSKDK